MPHYPAFDELCDRAERSGLQVRLAASSDRVFGRRKGVEYRRLIAVELWPSRPRVSGLHYGGQPVESAPIVGDDLEAAALDLLARAV